MSKLKEIQPTFDALSKNVRKLKLVGLAIQRSVTSSICQTQFMFPSPQSIYGSIGFEIADTVHWTLLNGESQYELMNERPNIERSYK